MERDDLYIRFKHVQKPLGEPSDDSRVIFFYDDGKIVGLEIDSALEILGHDRADSCNNFCGDNKKET